MRVTILRRAVLLTLCLISMVRISFSQDFSTPASAAAAAKGLGASGADISKLQGMSQRDFDMLKSSPQGQAAMMKYTDKAESNSSSIPEQSNEYLPVEATKFDINQQEKDYEIAPKTEAKLESKIFGHNLFNKRNLTFAPSINAPTPSNYILAAGDQVYVNIWGTAEASYELTISRDGDVNIPHVGVIPISGLTISQAEQRIKTRLRETVAGLSDGTVNLTISLNKIRSLKVNIVGEAMVPGTYTLSAFSTLFNALYIAGGVNDIGSLRNIKLYRNGKLISTLDVYDYLINGKQEVNQRLEDNDMIIVEPYTKMATVDGNVKRALTYELKEGEDLGKLIDYAGGYRADAFTDNLTVRRSSDDGVFSTLHTIPKERIKVFELKDGDTIFVASKERVYQNEVMVRGAVWREGYYALDGNIKTVGELVRMAKGVRDNAYLGRAHIMRTNLDGSLQIVAVNLGEVMNGTMADVPLQNADVLVVGTNEGLEEPFTVSISGEVQNPLEIKYRRNITLQDMVMLAGGFKQSAALSRIDISRRIVDPYSTNDGDVKAEVFSFEISDDLALSELSKEFRLEPFDVISVRRSPGYQVQQTVSVEGEVAFPGNYVLITNGDKLATIIQRAGGLTKSAFTNGAILYRRATAQEKGKVQAKVTLGKNGVDTTTMDVDNIGQYYSIGIDLVEALADTNSNDNIVLRPHDKLVIPGQNSIVKISGCVLYPNAVSYISGKKLGYYISQAGGFQKRALRRSTYVVQMNGKVSRGRRVLIEPGSEIIVPKRSEGTSAMVLYTTIFGGISTFLTSAALVVSMTK